jgi:hypothetical protein
MAPAPTPRETALKILEIFVTYFKRSPGSVLSTLDIIGVWNKLGLHHADLKRGLDYAEEQGWIGIFDRGNSFRLTEEGFTQAKDRH